MHVKGKAKAIVAGWMIFGALGVERASASGPILVSAVSRKTHAPAGDFDIGLPLEPGSAAVEGRRDGPTHLILTFSEAIAASDGTADCSEVTLSSGSCTGVSIAGNEMTIDLTGAAQEACLSLTVIGIQDTAGNPLTAHNDVHVRVLYGDRTGDGVVDIVDLNTVKQDRFEPPTAGNFPSDVNADGVINIVDLSEIKRNVMHTAPVCAPPGMVLIPAGEFLMGNSFDPSEGYSNELPRHVVYVDAFYMDCTQVTNQQYADALNWAWSQGNLITVISGVVSGKENHPIVRVSWFGAVAYANWRSAMQGRPLCYDLSTSECHFDAGGYRLPTEAEWEKAARGGVAGHRFPWLDTDTIQHARANYFSSSTYWYDTSPTRGYHPLWGVGDWPYTSPVGFFNGEFKYKADWGWPGPPTSYQTANGANGYDLYDMAGNVWEWCNDWYDGAYYSSSPYSNPRGPTSGSDRVVRGGSWNSYGGGLCRVALRFSSGPAVRSGSHGFRCAAGAP